MVKILYANAGTKKNKAFAYRVSIGDYNYLQCSQSKNIDTPDGMKNYDYE